MDELKIKEEVNCDFKQKRMQKSIEEFEEIKMMLYMKRKKKVEKGNGIFRKTDGRTKTSSGVKYGEAWWL